MCPAAAKTRARHCRGRIWDAPGFTLIELLVAGAVGVIVLLALGGFYLSTLRFYEQSSAQVALQRQAALALDEMARQIRPAQALVRDTCNGVPHALRVRNADGDYCFYQDANNQLIELRPPPNGTWNLLAGAPTSLSLTPGSLEFCFDPPACTPTVTSGPRVRVRFMLRDGGGMDPFSVSATLKRRN